MMETSFVDYSRELEDQLEKKEVSLPTYLERPPSPHTLRQRRASTNGGLGEIPTVECDPKRDPKDVVYRNR